MKKDEITKYIEHLYDEKSTLNEIQDLSERKKEAAKKAGMDPENKATIDIMNLKNAAVNQKIFEYLTRTQSNNFIALMSDQQLFWEIQFDKMTPSESTEAKDRLKDLKIKTAMSKEVRELLDRITYLYREVFRYDDEIKMGAKIIRMRTPEQRIKSKTA